MKNKSFIYGYIAILVLILMVIFYRDRLFDFNKKDTTIEKMPASFNECLASGFPIQEIYPRRCVLPSGQSFQEDIGNELDKIDLIMVTSPRPNSSVKNPLVITGQARGSWFFEASFPVILVDANNKELAKTIAQAQSDWMTTEFVPFTAELNISNISVGPAKLILKKDNPSGDATLDDQLVIPLNIID